MSRVYTTNAAFFLMASLIFASLAPADPPGKWIPFDGGEPGLAPDVEVLQSNEAGVILRIRTYGMYSGDILADGEVYQWLKIPGCGQASDVGKPEVPVKAFFVEIPYGVLPKIEVLRSNSTRLEGLYNILPVQEPLPDMNVIGIEAPFVKDQVIYSQNRRFPIDLALISEPGIIRGRRVVSIGIFPIKYNPGSKRIEVFTVVELKVSYIGEIDHKTAAKKMRLRSKAFKPIYEGFVVNAEESEESGGAESATGGPGGGADYLIITHDDFYDNILPLADWKHKKGLMTEVVALTDIGLDPTADDIKDFIQNAYDTWTPAPTYVLLVGDVDYIPTSAPSTDLYYGTVEGDDYYPDIFVGRLPVDISSVETVVTKVLDYDRTPAPGNWYDNVLIAAYFQDDNNDSYADRFFLQTAEMIHDFLATENYTCTTVYTTNSDNPLYYYHYDDEPDKPIPSGLDFTGTTQNIIDAINAGVMLAQHRDHGGASGWSEPRFTTSDIPYLTNGSKLPVIFSINCLSGRFQDTTDCFCEAILEKAGGGAVGAIGATEVSYSGYNDELARGFYDAMWQDFYSDYPDGSLTNQIASPTFHLGAVLNYGKFAMYDRYVAAYPERPERYPWEPSGEVTLLEFEIFHVIGDPELSIITKTPQTLTVSHPTSITLEESTLLATVDQSGLPIQNAQVCVMKDGEVYEVGYTDGSGQVTIAMDPAPATLGTLAITVTSHDCIPYEGTCDVAPPAGPYMVYDSHIIDDNAGGNGNGEANPDEMIVMPVTLGNVGDSDGSGINGIINTDTTYVVIADNSAGFSDIPAGGTGSSAEPHFAFNTVPVVPEGTVVSFTINWTAGGAYSGQTSFDVPIVVPYVLDYADQDIFVSGTVSGDYFDTHESDGLYESITEVASNPGPNAYSYLEHKWNVYVRGGTRVTFCVEAHRSANTEDDLFVFSYSIDDVAYTDMVTVGATSDLDQLKTFEMPNTIIGNVYIRVVDTDRTKGNRGLDTVYVDQIYIKSLTVPNNPPVADAKGPYSGTEDITVTFDGSNSYDPDGDPLTYDWDFGDGTGHGTGMNPTYTYTAGGSYPVTLVVSDGIVDSTDCTTAEITEVNDPPVADAGPDKTAVVGSPVIFDAAGSYDPDGNISAYHWDFGDGSNGTGETVIHSYPSVGQYEVTLTVTDDGEPTSTDIDIAIVTVTDTSTNVMHVSDIEISLGLPRTAGKNTFTKALATVTIVDEYNDPVAGATVYGSWSGATTDTDSGVTDSEGKITLESDEVKNAPTGTTFTFTVADVVLSSWTYDQNLNVKTSDSVTVP